jgi:type IV pilus assembly protein PilZ
MGLPKYATRPLRKAHPSGTRAKPQDRRALTRLTIELDVLLIWDGTPRPARVTDLGIGGLFVECSEPPPFNTSVLVVLDHTGGPLRLPGIVRWSNEVGMGLQLGLLGARETHAIAELLGQARSAQGKP